MSNKLPWMKHYADARKDLFVRGLQDRFGHFGYAGWFRLLEVLHEHGSGDNLWITWSQLAEELSTKPSTARQLVAICQSSGKVDVEENGQQVRITVKNFRKMQANKHREKHSVTDLENGKPVLEGDVEGEGDKDKLGFLDQIKRLASGFRVRPWTNADLEGHQFPFGKEKGRKVIDMEPSRCEWYLAQLQMDAKTTAALRHRIKLKQMECK